MSNHILIVDDDREIAKLAEIYMQNEGYHVLQAQDGLEALNIIERVPVNLIVLDIMMPNMDGLELCKHIRVNNQVPILMLSAKVQDMDKIMGLMTGADDYMVKPFNPLELMARVKALLRRSNYKPLGIDKDIIRINSLEIDKQSHKVMAGEKEIKLTSIEFDILYFLAKNQGTVYSSEEIFERVWKEESMGSNKTVMVHIKNIRDKIEFVIPGETIIQTVWGVGYKIEKGH
ncbi:DNA-binding response OmpR family regulator [Cytobacillus eiseniae]|uniref:DNA-binding response OmpR family regulator n=1 Tax=Cytobacillus eiseniae TaxID=762947 RepID=A0ABS4RGV3_9BACI|nr:response regulator transcription factor [Cytobacillus eiseniae]MBP2242128.1 DNA-binding response OmpR family regulator [Cytobacillus eiseniae]